MKMETSLQGNDYTEKAGRTILGFVGCLDIFGKAQTSPLLWTHCLPMAIVPTLENRPAYSIDPLFLNTAMPI